MDTRLKDAIRAVLCGAMLGATPAFADLAATPAPAAPAATPAARSAPVVAPAPVAPASTPAPTPRAAPTAPPARYAGAGPSGQVYPDTLQGGQMALDAGDPASAAYIFSRVAARGGTDAQSALYWQAFAEHRAGRHNEALETLHQFERKYPQSRWSDEAKALQVAASRAAGKPLTPQQDADEELKLYALDGLMQMEPQKALPILKKFMAGNASPRLKERALFIASQADLPEANALVLAAARDARDPELQRNAIMVLAQTGDEKLLAALRDVYRTSTDLRVRNAVIDAFMMADDAGLLLEVAKTDPDPKSRGRAAEMLGALGAVDELRALYKQEKDPEVRQRLANGLMIAGETDALLDVARNEADPRARRSAIQLLGAMGEGVPDEAFEELYRGARDGSEKDAVIDALQIRESATPLVKLFRAESDPARKRRMLQALSVMDSPEAEKLVMEILEK